MYFISLFNLGLGLPSYSRCLLLLLDLGMPWSLPDWNKDELLELVTRDGLSKVLFGLGHFTNLSCTYNTVNKQSVFQFLKQKSYFYPSEMNYHNNNEQPDTSAGTDNTREELFECFRPVKVFSDMTVKDLKKCEPRHQCLAFAL